jgi:hypothetical protein
MQSFKSLYTCPAAAIVLLSRCGVDAEHTAMPQSVTGTTETNRATQKRVATQK